MSKFFGYGSLVNVATHDYRNTHTATVNGWERHWVPSNSRPEAFLSVRPKTGSAIMGLIADVAPIGWEGLDLREIGYTRAPLTPEELAIENPNSVQMYRALPDHIADSDENVHILLSYLDVVTQGFLREFGLAGVENFYTTTANWHIPVRDDRAEPAYPRAQNLSASETALVDGNLARLGVTIF